MAQHPAGMSDGDWDEAADQFYADDDRMGEPWCRDFEGHKALHEFCGDHQASWCRKCDHGICPECVDDPHCRDCGAALFEEDHNWDCM
jgi:hypothetical protein